MSNRNLIAVVFGGIGNQLFIYAAARRLAIRNGANLLLDIRSGFEDDSFAQTSQLDKFAITAAEAPEELLYGKKWGEMQRSIHKRINRWLPYGKRWLVMEDTGPDKMTGFDPRFLDLKLCHENTYLLDYFQCELYFSDIREVLLKELAVSSKLNDRTIETAARISAAETPVAVHARQLRGAPNVPGSKAPAGWAQKSFAYYEEAINYMIDNLASPHFFCFGDDPEWFRDKWNHDAPVTFVSHNNGQEEAVQDLHLMGLCKHFVVGNSTFSWWPAWLSEYKDKIVLAPANTPPDVWSGNRDIIPSSWRVV